ncbi:hypothetical protein GJAV_G00061470 [Gymnothorax javanicus]|nr:hypothetical protein GJAV_G00061470 [Gymnothorax javanicus]
MRQTRTAEQRQISRPVGTTATRANAKNHSRVTPRCRGKADFVDFEEETNGHGHERDDRFHGAAPCSARDGGMILFPSPSVGLDQRGWPSLLLYVDEPLAPTTLSSVYGSSLLGPLLACCGFLP